jgi:ABC-2 type transport system permease protein
MAVMSHLRTLKYATWLGWQMESNWTKPWLFVIYSIARPIAATLILVFMFLIIQGLGGQPDPDLFSYMFIGNAFYMYVAQVLFGVTWVVHEDREHYQTLKQVYIAPISFYAYLVGRSVSKVVITTLSVIITLAFGALVLQLPLDLGQVDWPLFAVAMIVGLFCISTIGIALAGISFLTARHSAGINEGIAGMFYLFCGVVFPLTILPDWGQSIGLTIPITYWLEIVRRAIQPGLATSDISGLGGYSDLTILLYLAISTVAFLVISIGIFRYADHVARKKGKVDMTTTY